MAAVPGGPSLDSTSHSSNKKKLTAWSRVLGMPPGTQLFKNFATFLWVLMSIAVFTAAPNSPYSESGKSTPHIISLRSNVTLSSHLCVGLRSGLFSSEFYTKILRAFTFYLKLPISTGHLILIDSIVLIISDERV
jgi:hypothetical protein